MRRTILLLSLAACLASAALADTLTGQVVAVADGDTITILDETRAQHKIRLAGIDAPERRQLFGERSKQHLAQLACRQNVTADCYKRDRYGRLVCTVYANGRDVALA